MSNIKRIYLGAGCFWCVEAVFQNLKGVLSVKSGYMGGQTDNPTYKDICTGTTGHAEVILVEYDESHIPIDVLMEIFWSTHDPTTPNQQGADKGTQYRSCIYYTDETQLEAALRTRDEIAAQLYKDAIVTEIKAAEKFYPAEDYHQNYYSNNQYQPYCAYVITPKLVKLIKNYKEHLQN
jgi:peptide-methionine (S)-S-oxide reductase